MNEATLYQHAIECAGQLNKLGAIVAQPCEVCGCQVFLPVAHGVRCAWCYPPLQHFDEVRRIVEASRLKEVSISVVASWPAYHGRQGDL